MKVNYENIRDMVAGRAQASGERCFVWFNGREVSFREFDQLTDRFAAGLAGIGLGKGDIVYILSGNSPEFLVAAVGANKIGAVAGPLNTWLKPDEIQFQLGDSKGRAIVVAQSLLRTVQAVRPAVDSLEHVIVIGEGEPPEGCLSYGRLLAEAADRPPEPELARDDLAYIFYTAGTTGRPKGALLSHWNVVYEVAAVRAALEMPGEDPESAVALIFLPLFHVNAMMSLLGGMYRGIKTVMLDKFSVSKFGPSVEEHGCTFFSAVPKVYKILLQAADTVKRHDLSSLKYGICGAAPMPVETIRRFEETFGVEILEGYGLTEGTVASTLHRRGQPTKIGSIGPALPGQQVCIVDEQGNETPVGEVGEIVIRGDNVMTGYLGREEETAKTLRGGWLHTGDCGYVDEDGYFYIVERETDMIIKGGENIYPKEVENVLYAIEEVHDVAVVGVPDEMSGEVVKAFIVPRLGLTLTEEEVLAVCREKLADYKIPDKIEFVVGLPASAVGKVLKRLLRAGEGFYRIADVQGQDGLAFDQIFQMMSYRFNAEKAGDWKAAIQYEIFGKGAGTWHLVISDGKMESASGPAEAPTCIVRTYAGVFMKLVSRELDAMVAINSGLVQIHGNDADMAMLAETMEA